MDGAAAFNEVLARAGFESPLHAVAKYAVFLHPDTVAQTRGEAVVRVIRGTTAERHKFFHLADGTEVMKDDNYSPGILFQWAIGEGKGEEVQFNHLWSGTGDPARYTGLWNVCRTPVFLANITDRRKVIANALRYRAAELYGVVPRGEGPPTRPENYASLVWAEMPPPVPSLERRLREELSTKPKNRVRTAAERLGWVFSDFEPVRDFGHERRRRASRKA